MRPRPRAPQGLHWRTKRKHLRRLATFEPGARLSLGGDMPVKQRIVLVVAIALSGATVAGAQTEEGRQACMNDAFQFCQDAIPDHERVFRCLEFSQERDLGGLSRGHASRAGRGAAGDEETRAANEKCQAQCDRRQEHVAARRATSFEKARAANEERNGQSSSRQAGFQFCSAARLEAPESSAPLNPPAAASPPRTKRIRRKFPAAEIFQSSGNKPPRRPISSSPATMLGVEERQKCAKSKPKG